MADFFRKPARKTTAAIILYHINGPIKRNRKVLFFGFLLHLT